MLSKYDWIATDKEYFGQPNTAFDFGNIEQSEAKKKMERLQEQKVCIYMCVCMCLILALFMQDKLSKSVNMRAMTMLGKAEEKVK